METGEPFSAFMDRALHDPERGYYARRVRAIGRQGDFATSATLSKNLARGIAEWIRRGIQSCPGVKSVIEIGAGSGDLLAEVRRALGWWMRRRLRFHIVESSPVLRERQQRRGDLSGVTWHAQMAEALQACDGRALIFHNELLDAFPVILAEWQVKTAEWQEVWVLSRDGTVRGEDLRPLRLREDQQPWFSALREWTPKTPPAAPRQRVELAAAAREWLRAWASAWRSGWMLIVDYGDGFPALYHRRPRGTLRAYLMHQRIEGPGVYTNPGRQDITADVNFTDLRAWCEALGWREVSFETQSDFLQRMGIAAHDHAGHRLADSADAGGAFKCFVVAPGRHDPRRQPS
jgi:SAM-dependent MidA family methyltransferase